MSPRSHFDFRRYGKYMLVVAFFLGLFLTRHFASCLKHYWVSWDLSSGYSDAEGETGLIEDSGAIRAGTDGSYDEEVLKRANFPSYAVTVCRGCAQHKSFSDPFWAFASFWSLLAMGLAFAFIDRFIATGWRDEVRKRNEVAHQERAHAEEAQFQTYKPARRTIEPIDVDGYESQSAGAPVSLSNSGTHLRAGAASLPPVSVPTSMPEPTGRPAVRSPAPPARGEPEPSLAGPPAAQIDPPLDAPPPLVLLPAIDDAPPESPPSNPALDLVLDRLNEDWLTDEPDAFPDGHDLFDFDNRPDADVVLMTDLVDSKDQSQVELSALGATDPPPGPTVPLPGRTDFLPQTEGVGALGGRPRHGLFVPTGRERDQRVYAAPQAGQNGASGLSPEDPVGGIEPAIALAAELVAGGQTAQIRLLPGTYRTAVRLPPGVALINHATPCGLTAAERRQWLLGVTPADTAERVTIAAPPNTESTVYLHTDANALIAGVHIVGDLRNRGSRGVDVEGCARATLYLCRVADHHCNGDGAGIRVAVPEGRPKSRLLLQDCVVERNHCTGRGGGVFVENAVACIRDSSVNANEAGISGGGVYAQGSGDDPILIEGSRLERNAVRIVGEISTETGHGGAISSARCALHLIQSDLIGNMADGDGGGLYATQSQILIEGKEDVLEHRGLLADNRAVRGGAIMICGEAAEPRSTLRVQGAKLVSNRAERAGGAIAAIRTVLLEVTDAHFQHNEAVGEHSEGGAVYLTQGCHATFRSSAFLANDTQLRGGAVCACNSSLRIQDGCEIRENRSHQGDTGGVAHYAMESPEIDALRRTGNLEEPLVFALSAVPVEGNQAAKAVGGIFVGNHGETSTLPVTIAIRDPSTISGNSVTGQEGEPTANLLVFWKHKVCADDEHPLPGPVTLR